MEILSYEITSTILYLEMNASIKDYPNKNCTKPQQGVQDSVELAQQYPNIFLNTTGMCGEVCRFDNKELSKRPTLTYNILNYLGWRQRLRKTAPLIPEKVVFGTDFPILNFDLKPVNTLEQSLQHSIFYGNPLSVFDLTQE